MRIRSGGWVVDPWLLCRRVDKPMRDEDALRRDTKVVPLRPETIDDGEIRLGPIEAEPLTAAQEAQAVELLAALFAAAARRKSAAACLRRAA
jgi:hypothetical protein